MSLQELVDERNGFCCYMAFWLPLSSIRLNDVSELRNKSLNTEPPDYERLLVRPSFQRLHDKILIVHLLLLAPLVYACHQSRRSQATEITPSPGIVFVCTKVTNLLRNRHLRTAALGWLWSLGMADHRVSQIPQEGML